MNEQPPLLRSNKDWVVASIVSQSKNHVATGGRSGAIAPSLVVVAARQLDGDRRYLLPFQLLMMM
jgi:hypothetical protein